MSAEEYVSEDWAAVAKAINERVKELGWPQRELAERSHVSPATVRELQRHTVERRRSARTLEALSTTLGWHPEHLDAVLHGKRPPRLDSAADAEAVNTRLDALETRLIEITERLDDVKTDLTKVIEYVRTDR